MTLALLFAVLLQPPGCHDINQGHIYGADLAAALPVFASLAPAQEVGFSPAPGQKRTFRLAELRRIAKANGIEADITDEVCFAWTLSVPKRERIEAAMRKTLDGRSASINIIEQSLTPVPEGEVVFPLSTLSGVSQGPVMWKGYVLYDRDQRLSIWARVEIRIKEARVVAAETLRAGEPVSAVQLRTETYEGPLTRERPVTEIAEAIGKIAQQPIASGSVVMENFLLAPRDVERGDSVAVIAESGAARIETQGFAEEGGRRGMVILVRNTSSGKKFKARIEAKGKVAVIPGSLSVLVPEEKKS